MIMIGMIGHKMAVAAVVAALAAGGSAMFAGTASAAAQATPNGCGCQPAPAAPAAQPAPAPAPAPKEESHPVTNNFGGAGGSGGNSSSRCAVPVGVSGALILAQSNDVQQCVANGGLGGLGGAATHY
jgi:pyruvate/2-oxoglutarate dehydrogenase complex dihydrolipoamide acyltransferase (E2) component